MTGYVYRDAAQSAAAKLLTDTAGNLYRVNGDSRAVLHLRYVNGGPWVILTRV